MTKQTPFSPRLALVISVQINKNWIHCQAFIAFAYVQAIDAAPFFTTVHPLFEMRQLVAVHLQSNVWEPREIRGRLRHCDRLQTPKSH